MQNIDYLTASNLSILILSFIGGLAVSFFFSGKGIRGCITYLVSAVIVIFLVISLTKGYSEFLSNITYHLTNYIYFNTIGVFGFLVGMFFGFWVKKRRS